MDFLPGHAGHPRTKLLEVPYAAGPQYDFLGFQTFAARQGFVEDGRLREPIAPEDLAALMQSWLYFGLLAECIGIPIKREDFITTGPNHQLVVSGACLFDYIDLWISRTRKLAVVSPDWSSAIAHARDVLRFAIKASSMFDKVEGMDQAMPATVAISVKALITTLAVLHNELFEQDDKIDHNGHALRPWHYAFDTEMPYPAKYLHSVMCEQGWCQSLIRRICKRYDYNTVLYLLHLERNDHKDHSSCTATSCKAYSVDQASYTPRHVSTGCQCSSLEVDTARIASLVERGRTPIVSVDLVPNSGGRLMVEEAEQITEPVWKFSGGRIGSSRGPLRAFAAISHVWADGLGNPNANAILRCQFDRIVAGIEAGGRVGDVFGKSPRWFWLDTLCIPIGQAHAATRMQAIDRMAYVYASAAHSIVLDSSIMTMTLPRLGPLLHDDAMLLGIKHFRCLAMRRSSSYLEASQVLGKVLCSPWAGRSWTLQEGVLSEQIHFALHGEPLTSAWLAAAAATGRRSLGSAPNGSNRITVCDTLRRINIAAAGLTCLGQAMRYPLRERRASATRNKYALVVLNHAWGWLVPCLAFFACLELFCWYAVLILLGGLIAIAVGIVAFPMLVCVALLEMCYATDDQSWMDRKFELSDSRTFLSLNLFRNLARESELLLHNDHKSTMAVSRGRHEVSPALRCAQFERVWEDLSERSTTKPEDIHYIVGILCNLRVQPMRLMPAQERFQCILQSFEEVPAGLMFLSAPGASPQAWFPPTPTGDCLLTGASLRRTDEGLLLKCRKGCRNISILVLHVTRNESPILRFGLKGSLRIFELGCQDDGEAAYASASICIIYYDADPIGHMPWTTTAAVFDIVSHDTASLKLHFRRHSCLRHIVHHEVRKSNRQTLAVEIPMTSKHVVLQPAWVQDDHALLYRPGPGMYTTQAQTTFSMLLGINAGLIGIYCIWLVYKHRNMHKVLAIVAYILIAGAWILLMILASSLILHCKMIAQSAHYTSDRQNLDHAIWRSAQHLLEAWDAAIAQNFQPSDDIMERYRLQDVPAAHPLALGDTFMVSYILGWQVDVVGSSVMGDHHPTRLEAFRHRRKIPSFVAIEAYY